MEELAVAKPSMSVRKVFLAKLESIYTGKARQARENRLRPYTAARPRPVHEFGQRLDGTGRHPVYGPVRAVKTATASIPMGCTDPDRRNCRL
jgi:hypothetical protein